MNLITELSSQNHQVLVPSLFLYEVLSIAAVSLFSITKAHALVSQYQLANLDILELDPPTILKATEICEQDHKEAGFLSFYSASAAPIIMP